RAIFQPGRYLQEGTVLNVRTKRGCPFRCIYCTTAQIEGSRMRLVSPQKVVSELETLYKDYGAREFYFTDNIFNYPAAHAEAICREIIARKMDINWYGIGNPCSLTKELLTLMQQSGCSSLSIGNETGSPRMLHNLRKNFTVAQVLQTCQWCHELGINFSCFLLLGGPGENRQSVDDSITLMEKVKPNFLAITIGIRIYDHTELAQMARYEGVINAQTDLLAPTAFFGLNWPVSRSKLATFSEQTRPASRSKVATLLKA
ncbi:MAG: radical SAM protein, partial [Dehalococcoidales bacterium]|nr:radical SAM protein [Dehalococcoidales bacterium]